MQPLLSVIIPCHGRERDLERALTSLSRQSDKDFEVIVCDDGSNPPLKDLVAEFGDRLRLVYEWLERAGRPSVPRNRAVNLASGQWLSFLDSDDEWDPRRVEAVRAHLTDDFDVVYHSMRVRTESQQRGLARILGRSRVVGTRMMCPDPLAHFARFGNPIATSGALVRADLFRRCCTFDESLPCNDDYDAWVRLAGSGARFRFVDCVLGTYYQSGADRLSKGYARAIQARSIYRAKHLELYAGELRSTLARRYDFLDAVAALESGDPALRPLINRVTLAGSLRHWWALQCRRLLRPNR